MNNTADAGCTGRRPGADRRRRPGRNRRPAQHLAFTNSSPLYSGALEDDDALVDNFTAFWRTFAAHLAATTDPEWVFIEALNEPVFEADPARWAAIQRDLLAVIREQAPQHTLLATSTNWSNLDTFLEMELLDDPNVVYNFHFYNPFLFTHQGATWTWDAVRNLQTSPTPPARRQWSRSPRASAIRRSRATCASTAASEANAERHRRAPGPGRPVGPRPRRARDLQRVRRAQGQRPGGRPRAVDARRPHRAGSARASAGRCGTTTATSGW